MRIAKEDGTIRSHELVFGPGLAKAIFLQQTSHLGTRLSVSNPPWMTYELRLDESVIGFLVFQSEVLREVRLFIETDDDTQSDWTMLAESRRKARHDQWLQATLGSPPYRFPWGSVESVFDERDMCSQVVIRYDQQ